MIAVAVLPGLCPGYGTKVPESVPLELEFVIQVYAAAEEDFAEVIVHNPLEAHYIKQTVPRGLLSQFISNWLSFFAQEHAGDCELQNFAEEDFRIYPADNDNDRTRGS